MMPRRLPAVLQALAGALVVGGVALLAWHPAVGRAASAPAGAVAAESPLPVPDPALASWMQQVVDGDIFSAARRPPSARWVPGEDPEASMSAMADSVTDALDAESGSGEEVPALFGTMLGGATAASALLRLDAALPAPQLYGVGDRAGGYRVVQITERSVTLDGPTGRIVLRLRDEDGKQP